MSYKKECDGCGALVDPYPTPEGWMRVELANEMPPSKLNSATGHDWCSECFRVAAKALIRRNVRADV